MIITASIITSTAPDGTLLGYGLGLRGFRFRVWDLGRVWYLGFRVWDSRFRVWDQGLRFGVWSLGCRLYSLAFRV